MNTRRRIKGVVTSNKMMKTVVVEISRSFRHPLYEKVVHSSKKLVVHDDLGCNVGDEVQIIESKPISKTKRFAVEKILSRQEVDDTKPVEGEEEV
jgi:small subunit ribosomal protein S17